MFVKKG